MYSYLSTFAFVACAETSFKSACIMVLYPVLTPCQKENSLEDTRIIQRLTLSL